MYFYDLLLLSLSWDSTPCGRKRKTFEAEIPSERKKLTMIFHYLRNPFCWIKSKTSILTCHFSNNSYRLMKRKSGECLEMIRNGKVPKKSGDKKKLRFQSYDGIMYFVPSFFTHAKMNDERVDVKRKAMYSNIHPSPSPTRQKYNKQQQQRHPPTKKLLLRT